MINGIKRSLQRDKRLNEEYALISEMNDAVEEAMMEENSEAISPTEEKEIEKVLKQIPEDISDGGDEITAEDIKATKKIVDPSPSELTESVEQIYRDLIGGF